MEEDLDESFNFSLRFILVLFVCVHVWVYVCLHVSGGMLMPMEDRDSVGLPLAGATGNCEPSV